MSRTTNIRAARDIAQRIGCSYYEGDISTTLQDGATLEGSYVGQTMSHAEACRLANEVLGILNRELAILENWHEK